MRQRLLNIAVDVAVIVVALLLATLGAHAMMLLGFWRDD